MALKYNGNSVDGVVFTSDYYGGAKSVYKIVKDGTTVWELPVKYYANLQGDATSSDVTARVSTTSEPSASTGYKSHGDTVYYEDIMRITYKDGWTQSVTTSYNPNISSLSAPVLTNSYAGNFGATCKNNNAASVTAKYYLMRGSTRIPSSGYYTATIAANSSTRFGGYNRNDKLYCYFEMVRTTITTTTRSTYSSGSVTGLSSATTSSSLIDTHLTQYTVLGTVATSNIWVNSSATKTSSSTSSTSGISSSSSSVTLGY